jgi:hypothetical protein
LPKPGEDVAEIRQKIFDEIHRVAVEGPTAEEMEKLRNSLCNDTVRGRQSTMYRAQRLAEFALYDSDPTLFDSELDHYLSITADDIREATKKHIDVDNRVVLDIVPAADEEQEKAAQATPQTPGDPKQPAAPAPHVPDKPKAEPDSGTVTKPAVTEIKPTPTRPEQSTDPADVPTQSDRGSGSLHI